MNKEVKELIAEIKEFSIEYCHNPYYDYTLTKEEVELLLEYINQLETNRDEAIELIQGTWICYCELDGEWLSEVQYKLLSILERGKE